MKQLTHGVANTVWFLSQDGPY